MTGWGHAFKGNWLGWQGSNLRMTGSKPAALPLGYTPNERIIMGEVEVICKGILP